MRKRVYISLIALVIIVGSLSIALMFPGWSRLNCWTWEIDINSGEKRYKRYLFWKEVSVRIEETWMSDILAKERDVVRDWRMVNTFSPNRRYSPHYPFHSAIHDLSYSGRVFKRIDLDPSIQKEIAIEIRRKWKNTNQDKSAGEYIFDKVTSFLNLNNSYK